jgi:hypothetical protein
MSATSKTKIAADVYKHHVAAVNDALSKSSQSSKILFEAFRGAYDAMYEAHRNDWKKFRLDLECDASTINKMIKIVQSDFVMTNLHRLPNAWSTLYKISKLARDHAEALNRALDEGELTRRSNLGVVTKLICPEIKARDSRPVLRYDSRTIDPIQLVKLLKLAIQLEALGVLCKDRALNESEENFPEAANNEEQPTPLAA